MQNRKSCGELVNIMLKCWDDDLTSIHSEGQDPIALMRWSMVRIFFKACYAFVDAGRRHKKNSSNCLFFIVSLMSIIAFRMNLSTQAGKYRISQIKPYVLR